jgi:hypothetical protein
MAASAGIAADDRTPHHSIPLSEGVFSGANARAAKVPDAVPMLGQGLTATLKAVDTGSGFHTRCDAPGRHEAPACLGAVSLVAAPRGRYM